MSIFVSEGIMSQDLLVPSTYSIPWVQFFYALDILAFCTHHNFDLRCYYYKHSPWANEHLSCLLRMVTASPTLGTLYLCLDWNSYHFVLFSCQIPFVLLPLSLHILLAPIFLCFFHAYDHFACQLVVVGFSIFIFFPPLFLLLHKYYWFLFAVFHANDHLGSQLLCGGVGWHVRPHQMYYVP
jgi:hypothetical protein